MNSVVFSALFQRNECQGQISPVWMVVVGLVGALRLVGLVGALRLVGLVGTLWLIGLL